MARFERVLRGALPVGLARQALDDPACTWLWRTLREAEAAGLDGARILRQAVASRTMAGARDVARVLDSRVRQMLDGIQPEPPGPWSDRVTRLDWEQRASLVAAYRERYSYAHPDDPIGPEPSKSNPEARADWHAALAALGRVEGIDLRGCTDGDLWLRRSTYERETAWAPPHVTEELRLMRTAERDAHVNAVRADHETRAAKDEQTADRHRRLAEIWRALEAKAATEVDMFAAVQETRRHWDTLTETTRAIAIAADLELRRRHPGMQIEPLRPHPADGEGRRLGIYGPAR
ncbi:MAG TPA: hypothetical protein VMV92_43955 [Streptosporangiaceae bacterium]|nr:hypothetical protein [Streptosporangiaceae bacterium]